LLQCLAKQLRRGKSETERLSYSTVCLCDVAVLKAVASIQQLISNHTSLHETANGTIGSVLHTEQVGDMKIMITKDKIGASSKLDIKLDGSQAPGMSSDELAQRNLLKGITADESATVHVRLPPCNFYTNTSISIL
jgi:hypothetical protein